MQTEGCHWLRRPPSPPSFVALSEELDASTPFPGDNFQPVGPDYANGVAQEYFNTRKVSIYAGSNEIQRNIMAKLVLGL